MPRWTLQTAFYAAGLAAIIVGGIYFGEPILMPAALGRSCSPSRWRRSWQGCAPSALGASRPCMVTVLLALLVIGALGTYIVTEFAELAHALPRYESNIAHKINSLRSAAEGNSLFATASAVLQRLDNDLSAPPKPAATKVAVGPQAALVEITSQQDTPLHLVKTIVGPLLDPLATIGIVIIFVVFILLQKEDLRDRFIRLAGSRDMSAPRSRSTTAPRGCRAISSCRPRSTPASAFSSARACG